MELVGYFGAVLIGVSLGLLGGGGSILAVPLLVYFFKVPVVTATFYSLFIVGLTSLLGFLQAVKSKTMNFSALVAFSIPSIVGVLVVRRFVLPELPQNINLGFFEISKEMLVMTAFAVVMLAASVAMIKPQQKVPNSAQDPLWVSVSKAFGVGAVTGFVGAGGGFLIVPALVVMNRLPMKIAIGTSLGVIAINSFLGFISDALSGVELDMPFVAKISALAVLGLVLGLRWGRATSDVKLKPLFGYFVMIIGSLIFISQFFM